jgi:hypothetical protein
VAAAAALVLAAPIAYFQAAANADLPAPRWAREWNGFRLAADARARLSGDRQNPQAGLTLGPGAPELARAAYVREPLASNALFVLALEQAPLGADYRAGPIAREAVRLDKRSSLLQLLMIADAGGRADFPALFAHADLLAAAHPELANATLSPMFARLGEPAAVPIVAAALAKNPRWADAFKRYVPQDAAALRSYVALRRAAGKGVRWDSDPLLINALAGKGLFDEAFALWREIEGLRADPYGFAADTRTTPIGWQLVESGARSARIEANGAMTVWVERGAGGEVARRLLQLPPGRYRLDLEVAANEADPAFTLALQCAVGGGAAQRYPLGARTMLSVGEGPCPAWWMIIEASALDSRHGIEATLSKWRLTRER